mmetsp:Transcript_55362/g.121078  ORF Transcript_55362/g.121078 Transcript_55362/m.121078 type:complete len:221 (-) Transcript_55362:140-802(-)
MMHMIHVMHDMVVEPGIIEVIEVIKAIEVRICIWKFWLIDSKIITMPICIVEGWMARMARMALIEFTIPVMGFAQPSKAAIQIISLSRIERRRLFRLFLCGCFRAVSNILQGRGCLRREMGRIQKVSIHVWQVFREEVVTVFGQPGRFSTWDEALGTAPLFANVVQDLSFAQAVIAFGKAQDLIQTGTMIKGSPAERQSKCNDSDTGTANVPGDLASAVL